MPAQSIYAGRRLIQALKHNDKVKTLAVDIGIIAKNGTVEDPWNLQCNNLCSIDLFCRHRSNVLASR